MIRRVFQNYNIDKCWHGCDQPATAFYFVKNGAGYWGQSNAIETKTYVASYCHKCNMKLKIKIARAHSINSDTKYELTTREEALLYYVMDG